MSKIRVAKIKFCRNCGNKGEIKCTPSISMPSQAFVIKSCPTCKGGKLLETSPKPKETK
jgi:hypothetical protein